MDEIENPKITITPEDINQANQLSFACPICANPVEKYVTEATLLPVECADCGTLYHQICWDQGGSSCAMIGCDCKEYKLYAQENVPVLTLGRHEIVASSATNPDQRNKRLKAQERRLRNEVENRSIFRIFFEWLLRRIRILDES